MQEKEISICNFYRFDMISQDRFSGIYTQRLMEFIHFEVISQAKIKTGGSYLLEDIDVVFGRYGDVSRREFGADGGVGENHGKEYKV
jgi:hypothetical protein